MLERNCIARRNMGTFRDFGPSTDEPFIGLMPLAELLVAPFAFQVLVVDLPGDRSIPEESLSNARHTT